MRRIFDEWVVTNPFAGWERRQKEEDNARWEQTKKRWKAFEAWCGSKIDRMTPPGFQWMPILNWTIAGLLGCSVISTFRFLARYGRGWRSMLVSAMGEQSAGPYWTGKKWEYRAAYVYDKVIAEGATLPSFSGMMSGIMNLFVYLMIVLLLLSALHYLYFYHESKSIYLMKRLPNRMEIHRRSLAFPMTLIAVCMVTVLLLVAIYFEIYHLLVPARCVEPGQLARFLREGIFNMWRGDGL
ncbi:MAG: hypothetical protein IJZ85_12820 [Lachnospiraceae bacterium]|nr:hypothetical protein [Lachnospiraceae bacterium]